MNAPSVSRGSGYTDGQDTVNGTPASYAVTAYGYGGGTGDGSCSGQITVTFNWIGSGSPPNAIAVDETCLAYSLAVAGASPGATSNGLGDAPQSFSIKLVGTVVENGEYSGCTGQPQSAATANLIHHWSVIMNPGGTFQRTVTPEASAATGVNCYVYYTATAYCIDVTQIAFDNAVSTLTNWTTDFATDGGTAYSFLGWEITSSGPVSDPVLCPLHDSSGNSVTPQVTETYEFGLAGRLYGLQYDTVYPFDVTGLTAAGSELQLTVPTSGAALPLGHYYYNNSWEGWKVSSGDSISPPINLLQTLTPRSDFFITWAPPMLKSDTATLKRVTWLCDAINGKTTQGAAADALSTACTASPYDGALTKGPTGDTWALLDGQESGDCLMLANLMVHALEMAGIQAESVKMRASRDDPLDQKVTDIDSEVWTDGEIAYLIMWFGPNPPIPGTDPFNAFEGVCHAIFAKDKDGNPTSDYWYTLNPRKSADTLLHLFNAVPFTQVWVHTTDGNPPNDISNVVETVLGTEPKPQFP